MSDKKQEPVFQQMPPRTELAKDLKKSFVGDRKLIEHDYTALEMRMLAELEKK